MLPGRVGPLVAALTMLVGSASCTVESPAPMRTASAPAILFQHSSVAAAWQTAQARRRPLVVMFTTDRCPYCDQMLNETYADPSIRQFLFDNAETVVAHASDNRELVQRLGVRGFPTTVIVSADGQVVDAIQGYVDARTFGARVARLISPTAASTAQQTAAVSR